MLPVLRLAALSATAVVVASLLHLGAHLTDHETFADRSQWLLMPLLALTVALVTRPEHPGARRPRLVRLLLAALAASWLGDTAPDLAPDGSGFLVMVSFFLVAQALLVVAFWPSRDRSILAVGAPAGQRTRRWLLAPYALAFGALVAACAPGADSLLVPVVVYGLALVTMAVLATGISALTAVGGAIFLVSDSLIALDAFADGYSVPEHGFWVMLTYVVAQCLVAAGVVRAVRDTTPTTDGTRTGRRASEGTPDGQAPDTSASTASVS